MRKLVKQVTESILVDIKNLDSRSVNDNVIVLKDLLTVDSDWFEDVDIKNLIRSIDDNLKIAISKSITDKQSKATKSFTDSLLKIDNLVITYGLDLYEDVVNLDSKSLTAEQLLEISIDNKVLIKTYDDSTKRIGKTTSILKKADELGVSLITSNATNQSYLMTRSEELGLNVHVERGSSPDSVRGLRLKNNKFLVDEFVEWKIIEQLIKDGNELLGGFVL